VKGDLHGVNLRRLGASFTGCLPWLRDNEVATGYSGIWDR
jgi:hypothetical protein